MVIKISEKLFKNKLNEAVAKAENNKQ